MVKERAKIAARKFKKEFKKSMMTAFIAAFGFLIALVWKDLITELVKSITSTTPISGQLFTALVTTFIAVIGILITTKLFSEQEEKKKNG